MPSATVLLLILSGALLIYTLRIIGMFSSKSQFPLDGRTAIVTGGSQGLGLSLAKQLASKGANVVIIARDVSKLQRATDEIAASARSPRQQRFHFLSYDLCAPTSAPQIITQVTAWNHDTPPDILFCCAGYAIPGFFASSSVETLRSQMDTIYWSSAYMAHAVLKSWTKPSPLKTSSANSMHPRHIVFICSIVAFLPIAGYAPYTPPKAAMRALADTLNQEVEVYNGARETDPSAPPADIKIHAAFPMGILTPGFENENKSKPELTLLLEKDDSPQTSDVVAGRTITRLEAGDYLITTQFVGHLLRGAGVGSSVRNGLVDVFYNIVGTIALLFVIPDIVSKCRKWGKDKGMKSAR